MGRKPKKKLEFTGRPSIRNRIDAAHQVGNPEGLREGRPLVTPQEPTTDESQDETTDESQDEESQATHEGIIGVICRRAVGLPKEAVYAYSAYRKSSVGRDERRSDRKEARATTNLKKMQEEDFRRMIALVEVEAALERDQRRLAVLCHLSIQRAKHQQVKKDIRAQKRRQILSWLPRGWL